MSRQLIDVILVGLLPLTIFVHLYLAPYTKVEESFNIQAIHDTLIHGIPTRNAAAFFKSHYDHFTFPGPVPRTFVGAVVMSGLTRPLQIVSNMLLSEGLDKSTFQIAARGVLGLLNAAALIQFKRAIDTAYGKVAGRWYIILQASQFHVMFYASRTLPNMFAFSITTLALSSLISAQAVAARTQKSSKRRRLALYLLTASGIIFRSEIAILLAMQTLYLLLQGRTSLVNEVIPAGLFGVIIGLGITVSVDSYFWQRFPLWPEWIGFVYNTIQGKSSDWGVSPWHYYFVNAIPRLLLNPISWALCIPLALVNRATRTSSLDIMIPLLAFVAIYSILPHKEWRFVIYIIPGITGVAAAGASWIWTRRSKTLLYRLLSLGLVGSTLLSFVGSLSLLYVSSLNYPGGEALTRLHEVVPSGRQGQTWVYMDNLACQTGVTRFLEKDAGSTFMYDKTENQTTLLDPGFWQKFDYVLAEDPKRIIGSWEVVDTVYGYSGIGLGRLAADQDSAPPLSARGVVTQPINMLLQMYNKVARMASQKLTGGRWPIIKMEPKIYILKSQ
ncbi:glycosyltransferase family 22 protein, partial [Aureobasidium melanogenum]